MSVLTERDFREKAKAWFAVRSPRDVVTDLLRRDRSENLDGNSDSLYVACRLLLAIMDEHGLSTNYPIEIKDQ